jgi:CheY-like chemotaxis protein
MENCCPSIAHRVGGHLDPPRPLRVLVADDEPICRRLLRAMVEHLGHHTLLATDGDEAAQQCRADRPDVVITDWQMPRLSGLALTSALRADPATAHLFVVLSTGTGTTEATACATDAGADAVLFKPFGLAQLKAVLGRAAAARASGPRRGAGECPAGFYGM